MSMLPDLIGADTSAGCIILEVLIWILYWVVNFKQLALTRVQTKESWKKNIREKGRRIDPLIISTIPLLFKEMY